MVRTHKSILQQKLNRCQQMQSLLESGQPDYEALSTLLRREHNGTYKFGNERVFIKIDEKNELFIEYDN